MTFPTINLQKVAVIVNSNIPQSMTDALWYINQRGLNPNLILTFDFADFNGGLNAGGWALDIPSIISVRSPTAPVAPVCTTQGYTGLSFAQACSQFITNNACEAILCSTYTPALFGSISLANAASDAYYWAQCQTQGVYVYNWYIVKGKGFDKTGTITPDATAAKWINLAQYVNSYPFPVCYTDNGQVFGSAPSYLMIDVFPDKISNTWKADNYPQIPHGRLGISRNPTNNFTAALAQCEVLDPLNPTQSVMYRNTLDAMAAEQTDNRSKLHYFSTTAAYVSMTAEQNARAYRYAQWTSVNSATIQASGGTYTIAQWNAATVPAFFGFAIGANTPSFNLTAPYQATMQGSYFMRWSSGSAQFDGWVALSNGCCATVGTFQEPFSDHCGPPPGDIFKVMYQTGCSMAEANFICSDVQHLYGVPGTTATSTTQLTALVRTAGWDTVCGDPLYRPYKCTNTTNQYIYPAISTGVMYPDGTVQGA